MNILESILERLNALAGRVGALERREIPSGGGAAQSWAVTATGWADPPDTALVYYRKTDDIVYVWFMISGTSDDTSAYFNLPYPAAEIGNIVALCRVVDDGTAAVGECVLMSGADSLLVYPSVAGGSWTASGAKSVSGEIFYQAG